MRTIIYEHILFGELRPWLGVTEENPLTTSTGTDRENTLSLLLPLLQAHPGVAEELRQQPMSVTDEDAPRYVGVEPEPPYNRPSGWYKLLIELESARIFELALEWIESVSKGIDRQYEINSNIRQWVDLLAEAEELRTAHDEKLSHYVLQLLQHHLMQLVLDFSLRYPDLEGADRYDLSGLYVGVLNRGVPKNPPFYKTAAYRSFQLKRLLRGSKMTLEPGELCSEIIGDMKAAYQRGGGQGELNAYKRLVTHLEDALFLQAMDASFIGNEPEKLLDARYCREWVQGIRRDFIAEQNPEEAAHMFSDLLDAREEFEQRLPAVDNGPSPVPLEQSAARKLLTTVQDICSYRRGSAASAMAEGTVDSGKSGDDGGSRERDFETSFAKRFISVDAFDAVLPGTREATLRYIKNADIRVLEISREVKFLYREDVEAFLEENTS